MLFSAVFYFFDMCALPTSCVPHLIRLAGSIQNEPDWNTKDHPVCIFAPAEDYETPGYYRAFDVVYDTLFSALRRMPEMIGPEATGFDNFATPPVNRAPGFQPAWYSGNPRVAAIANHLYDAGVHHDQPGFFDRLDTSLKNGRREADQTMTRKCSCRN